MEQTRKRKDFQEAVQHIVARSLHLADRLPVAFGEPALAQYFLETQDPIRDIVHLARTLWASGKRAASFFSRPRQLGAPSRQQQQSETTMSDKVALSGWRPQNVPKTYIKLASRHYHNSQIAHYCGSSSATVLQPADLLSSVHD